MIRFLAGFVAGALWATGRLDPVFQLVVRLVEGR